MLNQKIVDTVDSLRVACRNIPKIWDGKESILEMKEGGSKNWRQTEWQGWYFEYLCESLFEGILDIPGKKYGNTEFDAFSVISWDFKSHASNATTPNVITNDTEAILNTIDDYGYYGIILAAGVAKYNDEDGTFRRWHEELKGGVSEYTKKRIKRGAKSKTRKTEFSLSEIRFVCFDHEALQECGVSFQKGFRNADGSPRRAKVAIKTRQIPDDVFIVSEEF